MMLQETVTLQSVNFKYIYQLYYSVVHAEMK